MRFWKAYAIALGFVVLCGAAVTYPNQLKFQANGTGAILRQQSAKLADVLNARDYNVKCDGSTDDVAALLNAASDATSEGKSVRIDCRVRIASAAGTVSAPLKFEGAGSIDTSPAAGSITIAGPFTAPLSQIFYTGSGTLNINSGTAPCISPLWFGADATGTSDSSTAVTQAIIATPSDNGTVCFPGGIFKFNVTITKGGLVVRGSGSGNVNTGVGGTVFKANTASSPVLQIGDGTTTGVRGISITDAVVLGDGSNATGDGIRIYGARDVGMYNLTITSFGRDDVRIESSATVESSGVYMVNSAIANARGAGIRAVYGSQYVTNVSTVNCHINGYNSPAVAIYLDSVQLWMTGTYVDIPASASGHIVMVKNAVPNPGIIANSVSFDNAGGVAATSLDVSAVWAKNQRLPTAIRGNFSFAGVVAYSDGNVQESSSQGSWLFLPVTLNAQLLGNTTIPLDETDFATTVNLSRLNATGSNTEAVQLQNAALRLPLTVTFPINGITNGAIWRDATSGALRYRADSRNPSGDHQGVPFTPIVVTPSTASTTVTIDASLGNIFNATFTTNAVHTIANPGNQGTASNAGATINICVINTSGAALGVFTWSANYRFAAGTAPPTPAGTGGVCTTAGCRQCIQFSEDAGGTLWFETWRSTADIPN